MDPDRTLSEIRVLTAVGGNRGLDSEEADRLQDLVLALDEWLSDGGFLPKDWQR